MEEKFLTIRKTAEALQEGTLRPHDLVEKYKKVVAAIDVRLAKVVKINCAFVKKVFEPKFKSQRLRYELRKGQVENGLRRSSTSRGRGRWKSEIQPKRTHPSDRYPLSATAPRNDLWHRSQRSRFARRAPFESAFGRGTRPESQ